MYSICPGHISSRVRTNRVVADEAVGKTMDLLKRFAKQGWKEAVIAACHALSGARFVMKQDKVTQVFTF